MGSVARPTLTVAPFETSPMQKVLTMLLVPMARSLLLDLVRQDNSAGVPIVGGAPDIVLNTIIEPEEIPEYEIDLTQISLANNTEASPILETPDPVQAQSVADIPNAGFLPELEIRPKNGGADARGVRANFKDREERYYIVMDPKKKKHRKVVSEDDNDDDLGQSIYDLTSRQRKELRAILKEADTREALEPYVVDNAEFAIITPGKSYWGARVDDCHEALNRVEKDYDYDHLVLKSGTCYISVNCEKGVELKGCTLIEAAKDALENYSKCKGTGCKAFTADIEIGPYVSIYIGKPFLGKLGWKLSYLFRDDDEF